ncbi:MAG TPA: POTRA domain-containing protein [Xanthobacteraceae bacterium]|nr:POTRA domain-containing protein [Xanthobacteraceae bacterium]
MLAGARAIAAAVAMVCVSFAAVAQVVPSGAQLVPPSDQPGRERERFERPPVPLAQPGGPAIAVPGIEAPPGAAETTLVIRQIRIVGATVAAQLAELYADLIGKKVTLQAVYDIAQRITAKYGGDGYVLSRAIVPLQELDPNGAVVKIQVVEGYIETVQWPPQLSAYRDFFSYYASKITAERPVNIRTIERYLLLAGDLPGLKSKNSIKPHPSKVGAAILVVEVTPKPIDSFSRVDNRGTSARGPLQYLNSTTFNNLFGGHEALTLTAAGAFETRELQYYAANYRQVLTPEGLTYFATASYGFGRPGTEELEILEYRTRSFYAETGLSYPVIRARERNLSVSGLWFWSHILRPSGRAAEHARSHARNAGARGSGFRRRGRRHQSALFRLQPRGARARRHAERARPCLTRQRPGRFQQDGADGVTAAGAAAVAGSLLARRHLWPIRHDAAPGVRVVRLWRTTIRPRFRSVAIHSGQLPLGALRAALRYSHSTSGTYPDAAIRLLRQGLPP